MRHIYYVMALCAVFLNSADGAFATSDLLRTIPTPSVASTGAEVATDGVAAVSSAAVGVSLPKMTPAKAAEVKKFRSVLEKKAKHYRSLFFSTNCKYQSPANYRAEIDLVKKLFGQEASQILAANNNDITNAVRKIRAKKLSTAQERIEIAKATDKINSSRVFDDDGDERMMANCVGITATVYADLRKEWEDQSGLIFSMFTFAGLNPASDFGAHMFLTINCDGDRYIIDAWRGDGEVYGPLNWDAKTKRFVQRFADVPLDPYYNKPLARYLTDTVK